MKTLCALIAGLLVSVAAAQTICGPFSPSGRSQPLAPNTLYSFSASGTDPDQNKATDTLHIQAVYEQVQALGSP